MHAAELIPKEFVNKSKQNPKQKLIIKNVTLLILIGNVNINTSAMNGSNDPNKSNLLNNKPCNRAKNINLLNIKK